MTNEFARATLTADRCASYQKSTIEQQTESEPQRWRTGQKRKADRLAKEVRGKPRSTVQKLQSFGEGTRLMISCFEELIEDVQSQGHLPKNDLELAISLFGVAPTPENIRVDLMAYVITLFNLGCTPAVSTTVVEEMLKRENRPEVLKDVPVAELFGSDADENRELLVGELEGEVERLGAEADRLEREVDGPSLVAVLERASILTEKAARRVARSHSEARTSYHRASTALWPLLEREKEEGALESVAERDVYGGTEPAVEPVSAVPMSACRAEPGTSQIEPENMSDVLTQRVDEPKSSVEGPSSGPERQDDVIGPTPARENRPSEVPVERRGSEGEGDAPSVEAPHRPAWASMVPLSACRRADSLLTEEEEAAKNGSEVVDSREGSVDGRPSGPARQNGVSSPEEALQEPPSWGLPGLPRAAHLCLETGREIPARSPGV